MNKELIIKLKKNLDGLLENKRLDGKFVVLFGANTPGDIVINYLESKKIRVEAVIDNNPINEGKKLVGATIYTPGSLLKKYNDNLAVLICSRYYPEMKSQLEAMGYSEEKHIFKLLEMSKGEFSTDINIFENNVKYASKGFEIYSNIINKYGKDITIFVSPIKANGDTYIISSYINEYALKNNIQNYALAVVGNGCVNISKLFGIKNIISLSQKEADFFTAFVKLMGNDCNIKIIQPYFDYVNFYNKLDGYKALNFIDFFKYGFFGLNEEALPQKPKMISDKNIINKFFKDNGLKENKTVILSPFSNSLPLIELKFWERLAYELGERGYTVCTNSSGKDEPCIEGTKPICFPFEYAKAVAERAGVFIAVRSGLCEVLSSAECKKIIVYPDKACGFKKVKDVYGLNEAGFGKRFIELEYDDNSADMVSLILKEVL